MAVSTLIPRVIARIRTEFPTKFGVPRQSGLVPQLRARIVFEPEYRTMAAVAGIEGFTHLWLLWDFSLSRREGFSPTVRPPRLGGDRRMGVFATRSPFRPTPIGLSSVRLLAVDDDLDLGPVLTVGGADLVDGTPILDIKPYLPADAHPEASGGFTDEVAFRPLTVSDPHGLLEVFDGEGAAAARSVLSLDPRPAYMASGERVFGMPFSGHDIRFTVASGVLTVVEVAALAPGDIARTGHDTPSHPLDGLVWPRRTERLVLRRPRPVDVPAIFAYRTLPEVSHFLSSGTDDLEVFTSEFGAWQTTQLVVEHEGQIIGDLMVRMQDSWSQAEVAHLAAGTGAELGWVFAPSAHGNGFATEAVMELLEIAFEGLGVRRIEAGCFAENVASRRVMEKAGLRLEGIFLGDSLHRDGTWRDGALYALLLEEWQARPGSRA